MQRPVPAAPTARGRRRGVRLDAPRGRQKARKSSTKRQPADRSLKRAERGHELEERKGHDENAHEELDRSDESGTPEERPGRQRPLNRQGAEQEGAGERRSDCRQAKPDDDGLLHVACENTRLEDVVGHVNDRSRSHGDLDRQKESECRHQQRAQTETREEREQRDREREGGERKPCDHGMTLTSSMRPNGRMGSRIPYAVSGRLLEAMGRRSRT